MHNSIIYIYIYEYSDIYIHISKVHIKAFIIILNYLLFKYFKQLIISPIYIYIYILIMKYYTNSTYTINEVHYNCIMCINTS